MAKRKIAVRVTTRDINNALIFRPDLEDSTERVRVSPDLQQIDRVKLVGIVVTEPLVFGEGNYASVYIADIFGRVRLFASEYVSVDAVKQIATLEVGDIVQVIGRPFENTKRKRNEIVVEGVNKVPPAVLLHHLINVLRSKEKHKELLQIARKLIELEQKSSTDRRAKSEFINLRSMHKELYRTIVNIRDYVEQKILLEEQNLREIGEMIDKLDDDTAT